MANIAAYLRGRLGLLGVAGRQGFDDMEDAKERAHGVKQVQSCLADELERCPVPPAAETLRNPSAPTPRFLDLLRREEFPKEQMYDWIRPLDCDLCKKFKSEAQTMTEAMEEGVIR